MRGPKLFLAPAMPLLLAAVIAGCGPSADGENDGADALSDEEFVQRGDEICRSAQERVGELRREPPRTPREAARFTQELIAVFTREVADLRELVPPGDRREVFERYIRAREEAIALLERGLAAAEREDAVAYADAQGDVAEGQVERAELAHQAGFSACSRPQTASGAVSP